jgi:hypothetical protein
MCYFGIMLNIFCYRQGGTALGQDKDTYSPPTLLQFPAQISSITTAVSRHCRARTPLQTHKFMGSNRVYDCVRNSCIITLRYLFEHP